jgi:hypothetical protein
VLGVGGSGCGRRLTVTATPADEDTIADVTVLQVTDSHTVFSVCCHQHYRRCFFYSTWTRFQLNSLLKHVFSYKLDPFHTCAKRLARPAPKAAPRLARARQPSMGIPGLRRFCAADAYRARRQMVRNSSYSVCVFITGGPSTKLFTWGGGGIWEDMCYERRRAEACVD